MWMALQLILQFLLYSLSLWEEAEGINLLTLKSKFIKYSQLSTIIGSLDHSFTTQILVFDSIFCENCGTKHFKIKRLKEYICTIPLLEYIWI